MMLTTILAMTLDGQAEAADTDSFEISVGLGTQGGQDDNWSMFSYEDQLLSVGGRVGMMVTPRLAAVADYQVGRHGYDLWVDGEFYDDAGLDVTLHQLSLGPKVVLYQWGALRPYATAQAQGLMGRLRITEDPDDADSPARFTSATLGGVAALGVDLQPKKMSLLTSHLEAGYGRSFAMTFRDKDAGPTAADIGDLSLGGFYLRIGVGVRF